MTTRLRLWIARDENGSLGLFYSKPRRVRSPLTKLRHWVSLGDAISLSKNLYPKLRFEDGPQEVRDLKFEVTENGHV